MEHENQPTEPVYDWPGHVLAGSANAVAAGATVRTTYGEKFGHDESGIPLVTATVTVLPDAARRADIVQHIRDVSGDAYVDAVTGLRLARAIAADRSHPERVEARAAVADIPSDGEAPGTNGAAPDPYDERKHEVRTDRTAKGTTVVKRTRVGMAYVIGGTHAVPPNDPDAASTDDAVRARTAAAVLLGGVKRNSVGASALDIVKIADTCYRGLIADPIEPMKGTDVTSWEEVVGGDITDRSPVTVKRSYLSGQYSDPTWDAFAAPASVYRANTRRTVSTVRRPSRMRLKKGRNRAGDVAATCRAGTLRTVSQRYAAPVLVTPLVWSLVAPAADTDHRWQGHALVTRPKASRRSKARRDGAARGKARTEARTVGTVDAPESEAGWRELLDNLNRGERIVAKSDDGRVTVTRSKQRYEARDGRTGREHVYRLRNIDRMANALA